MEIAAAATVRAAQDAIISRAQTVIVPMMRGMAVAHSVNQSKRKNK